jgi:hypothetical protein
MLLADTRRVHGYKYERIIYRTADAINPDVFLITWKRLGGIRTFSTGTI